MTPTSMSRRRFLGAAAGAVGLATSSQSSGQASAKELRLGIISPENHTWNQQLAAMNAELKLESGGRLSILVFPSAQLGSEAAMVQQMQTGALDMAWITVAELSNRVPDFAALLAPFLAKDISQASSILNSGPALKILERLQGIGLKGLGYGLTGMRQIYVREKISSAAELSGRKIRIVPAAPFRDFYSLVGAAPTPVSFTQVYDALANGQIDAIDMDLEGTMVSRFYDHLKQVLLTNHFMFPCVALASYKTWSAIPAGDQDLLSRLMAKHLRLEHQTAIAVEATFLEQLRKTGVQITPTPSTFFGDIPQKWDATWGAKTAAVAELRKQAAVL